MIDEKKMTAEELKKVTGGNFYPVWTEDGFFEIWQVCNRCGDYEELRYRKKSGAPEAVKISSIGTFVCPKCGFEEKYNLSNQID